MTIIRIFNPGGWGGGEGGGDGGANVFTGGGGALKNLEN